MKTYYDILITLLLAVSILPAIFLLYHKIKDNKSWESKHPSTTNLIVFVLLFGALCVAYGSFIEPKILVTNYQTIDLSNIDKEVKIAFIADIQVGPYKREKHLEQVISRIKELNPDIVLIGGDQIMNDGQAVDEYKYLDPLAELAKIYPTYAINGNHEYGVGKKNIDTENRWLPNLSKETEEKMESLDIKYLKNDLELITINEQKFYLFGGDSFLQGNLDLNHLQNKDNRLDTIALIHNPAAAYIVPENTIDLFLAGHTHGGQIRLPIIGPFGKIETEIPKEWYQGWSEYKDFKLFVTSGTGETGARFRFLNPPEVVFLTIN